MKTVMSLAALFAVLSAAVYVAAPVVGSDPCASGLCVVEFNADFNASNSVAWIDGLVDCTVKRIDISSDFDSQKRHKIVVVPTIIIFKDAQEMKRFQANIMMSMEATKEDVQDVINDLIMSDF